MPEVGIPTTISTTALVFVAWGISPVDYLTIFSAAFVGLFYL